MIVIRSHSELIRDIKLQIERESKKLEYYERCKKGLDVWNLSKKNLQEAIDRTQGQLLAYKHCLEMAKSFQKFDESKTEV
jgi:hypothetical protein